MLEAIGRSDDSDTVFVSGWDTFGGRDVGSDTEGSGGSGGSHEGVSEGDDGFGSLLGIDVGGGTEGSGGLHEGVSEGATDG